MSAWQHTPGASGDDVDSEFVDHCIDCSEAAGEWVGWPCSAARLVKAAVEVDRYLRGMDEEARVAAREAAARAEALTMAAISLQRIVDYWDGRPLTGHGAHIYADLAAVLGAIDADAAHNEQATR